MLRVTLKFASPPQYPFCCGAPSTGQPLADGLMQEASFIVSQPATTGKARYGSRKKPSDA